MDVNLLQIAQMISNFDNSVIYAGIGVVFFAGLIRGFTGFGFSAICVALLSFFVDPALIVPVILMMEVAASAWLMPGTWRDADYKWLMWMMIGLVLGTPVGVWMLSYLPAETTKLVLYVVLLGLGLVGMVEGIEGFRRACPGGATLYCVFL